MRKFRRILHGKVTSPPCDLERWAHSGTIDGDLGLYLVDIPFEKFMPGMLMDDTSVESSRHGLGPF